MVVDGGGGSSSSEYRPNKNKNVLDNIKTEL